MPQRTSLYVIYMPYTLEEYNVGHLWTTCKVSLREANKGMRVSVIKNEPVQYEDFGEARNTVKVIDFSKKVSSFIRAIAPSGAMSMNEVSYNAFPRCRTMYTSRVLSEKKFLAKIDTMFFGEYMPAVDPFKGMPATERCEVLHLFQGEQLAEGADLSALKTETGAQKYPDGWETQAKHVMTIFKRVQIDFHMPIIGKRYIEDADKFIRKVFIQGHQEVVHYHNEWCNLTMDDVRKEEKKVEKELAEKYPTKTH
ncbi:hypothetical protein NECID01_1022 [Nematocida sp. AWRm77]|nr:hypothetical protein NECID01_1022 [Nematocida sp. AWRm77]